MTRNSRFIFINSRFKLLWHINFQKFIFWIDRGWRSHFKSSWHWVSPTTGLQWTVERRSGGPSRDAAGCSWVVVIVILSWAVWEGWEEIPGVVPVAGAMWVSWFGFTIEDLAMS